MPIKLEHKYLKEPWKADVVGHTPIIPAFRDGNRNVKRTRSPLATEGFETLFENKAPQPLRTGTKRSLHCCPQNGTGRGTD